MRDRKKLVAVMLLMMMVYALWLTEPKKQDGREAERDTLSMAGNTASPTSSPEINRDEKIEIKASDAREKSQDEAPGAQTEVSAPVDPERERIPCVLVPDKLPENKQNCGLSDTSAEPPKKVTPKVANQAEKLPGGNEKIQVSTKSAPKRLPHGSVRKETRIQSQTGATECRYIQYKVRAGDNLWEIAQNLYHTRDQVQLNGYVNQIIQSNPGMERQQNYLVPGIVLRIPIDPPISSSLYNFIPDKAQKAGTVLLTSHKIAKGETLYSVAAKYYNDRKKWLWIYDVNPGINPNSLPCGTWLKIPLSRGDN